MVDDDIGKNFNRIWPLHVMAMSQFLVACRKSFDGDLDLFLILCVIGDRTFSARNVPPHLDFVKWSAGKTPNLRVEDINVQSLADYSGIPRETVRRKLQILVDRGWVTRDERGFMSATQEAKDDLGSLTTSSLIYLTRMKALLSAY